MKKVLILKTLLINLLISGAAIAQTCTKANTAESTPTTARYNIETGGVATDNTTKLMWKRCLEGQTFSDNGTPDNKLDDQCTASPTAMNWQAALNGAETANATNDSGYSDWRLPNLKELQSTLEYCREDPSINTEVFPNAASDWVRSSSPYSVNPLGALLINFNDGHSSWGGRNDAYHVRLVRSVPVAD